MRLFRVFPSGFAIPIAMMLITGASRDVAAQRRRNTDYASRIDTTFAFDKNGSVTVSAASGNIVVTGWSRDQVHVRAVSEDDNIRLESSSSRMTLELGSARRGSDTRFE